MLPVLVGANKNGKGPGGPGVEALVQRGTRGKFVWGKPPGLRRGEIQRGVHYPEKKKKKAVEKGNWDAGSRRKAPRNESL